MLGNYFELIALFISLNTYNNLILDHTYWIDVCQTDKNLLATAGDSPKIGIFDQRCLKFVKTFDMIHIGKMIQNLLIFLVALFNITYIIERIKCVRWSPNGRALATASNDGTAKILDFRSGKVSYTGKTTDNSKSSYFQSYLIQGFL